MAAWKHYHTPTSVDEALDLLTRYAGSARVVAGGTDLLLELQHGHRPPLEALIDITRIPDLAHITQPSDSEVIIGAGVTHTQIVESPVIADRATCLVESCGVVGGPQVRNVGTLGGNVAHALPAGDGTVSLIALDAQAQIVKDDAVQWLPIAQMFRGPGQSLLDSTHDLLIAFKFDLCRPLEATAFKRIMRPQGVALPILGCAIWLRLTPDHAIDALRLCIAPIAPTPTRLIDTESTLIGQSVAAPDALNHALTLATDTLRREINPRTSKYRATAAYRIEMAEVLLRRAFPLAVSRAITGEAIPEGVGLK